MIVIYILMYSRSLFLVPALDYIVLLSLILYYSYGGMFQALFPSPSKILYHQLSLVAIYSPINPIHGLPAVVHHRFHDRDLHGVALQYRLWPPLQLLLPGLTEWHWPPVILRGDRHGSL